jgi:hypothetical protein
MRHADGTEETVREGQIYHWPAGHTGVSEEGVVFLEVGPVGRCDSSANTRASCSAERTFD